MMDFAKIFVVMIFALLSIHVEAHHYKGLPHNDYFANYPQVPTLEFLHEDEKWEIFLTVYNFQGIQLENVEDSNMIRLYIFLYDVREDSVYMKPTKMEIYSHGEKVYQNDSLLPEEESIYSIHKKIESQDDLELWVYFVTSTGKVDIVKLPFKTEKTFWQKYGLAASIIMFFILVGILKKFVLKGEKSYVSE